MYLSRKQRTRAHVLEDISFNHVEYHIFQCGYSTQRIARDYGIDLALFTYDAEGNFENGQILIQIKASEHFLRSSDKQYLKISIDTRDLRFYLAEEYPVILILYDARLDQAFWVNIQDHFAAHPELTAHLEQKSLTINVLGLNIFDKKTVYWLRESKNKQIQGT